MPRKSLRPHLNQIRAWVRQGRTDAWIAHQLEVSVRDIEQFERTNDLAGEDALSDGSMSAEDSEDGDLPAAAPAGAGAAAGAAPVAARSSWREPSTTARRDTGCGSTPPSRTTRSTPSTGRGTRR